MDEPRITRDCECGSYLITNDSYLLDAWNEWHEDGSFVAGRWHRPMDSGERNEGAPSS